MGSIEGVEPGFVRRRDRIQEMRFEGGIAGSREDSLETGRDWV